MVDLSLERNKNKIENVLNNIMIENSMGNSDLKKMNIDEMYSVFLKISSVLPFISKIEFKDVIKKRLKMEV